METIGYFILKVQSNQSVSQLFVNSVRSGSLATVLGDISQNHSHFVDLQCNFPLSANCFFFCFVLWLSFLETPLQDLFTKSFSLDLVRCSTHLPHLAVCYCGAQGGVRCLAQGPLVGD